MLLGERFSREKSAVGLRYIHSRTWTQWMRRWMLVATGFMDFLCLALFVAANQADWTGNAVEVSLTGRAFVIAINGLSLITFVLLVVKTGVNVWYVRFKLQYRVKLHYDPERVGWLQASIAFLRNSWALLFIDTIIIVPQPFFFIQDPYVSMAMGLVLFPRFFWSAAKIYREYSQVMVGGCGSMFHRRSWRYT